MKHLSLFIVNYSLFIFIAFSGCSHQEGPAVCFVEGTVIFDGKPLTKAMVVFQPQSENGIAASGFTNGQGVFRLTSLQGGMKDAGAAAGEYKVSVARDKDEPSSYRTENTAGGIEKIPVFESLIPVKYNNAEKSGLTATVKKGKNTFEFQLEK